jgi:hypothetical protein
MQLSSQRCYISRSHRGTTGVILMKFEPLVCMVNVKSITVSSMVWTRRGSKFYQFFMPNPTAQNNWASADANCLWWSNTTTATENWAVIRKLSHAVMKDYRANSASYFSSVCQSTSGFLTKLSRFWKSKLAVSVFPQIMRFSGTTVSLNEKVIICCIFWCQTVGQMTIS